MQIQVDVRERPVASLLVKKTICKHSEIGPAFGKAVQAVDDCCGENEAAISSPSIAVYLQWLPTECAMAVGYAVEGEVTLAGGCEWLQLPGGLHAVAVHKGPYDDLPQMHAGIMAWCKTQGLTMSGPCWESYPVGPRVEADSSKWVTDVHYPVVR